MEREKTLDLGSWIGLQKAFATVAGSCSAARAQCLKQVRDSHLLDDLGLTWEEFCKDHAGISRPHADSLIRQYDQFGDAYFRLSEIARISPKCFQKIAGHVDADSIEIDGQRVALTLENAPKVRAAIQALRSQIRRPSAPARPTADVIELQARVDSLASDVAKTIRTLNPHQDGASLRALVSYATNKFRALSRQLEPKN